MFSLNIRSVLAQAFIILFPLLAGCSQKTSSQHANLLSNDPALDPTCAAPLSTQATGDIVRVADVDGAVWLRYTVDVDPNSPALFKTVDVAVDDPDAGLTEQQPLFGAAKISAPVADVSLDVAIKRPTQRPDLLWMEWFVINDAPLGIADGGFLIENLAPEYVVYDLGANLWNGPVAPDMSTGRVTVSLGGVAPESTTRVLVGIGTADGSAIANTDVALDFLVTITGRATKFSATRSERLALTSDDAEVWTTVPEANLVVVAQTTADAPAKHIAVAGQPRGMAITPDDKFALTVAPKCNQLVVIDTETHQVSQRFGEAEGVGREPMEVVLSADGSRAYVTSYVGDSLAVFDRLSDGFAHVKTLATGRRPTGISISPDGGAAFVAHLLPRGSMPENEAWISVYDTKSLQLINDQASIPDGGNPEYTACLKQLPMFADYDAYDLQMEGPYSLLRGTYLHPSGTEALVPSMVLVPFLMFEGDMQAAGMDRPLGRITTSNILSFDTRKPAATHAHQLDTIFDIRDRDLEYQRCTNHNANMEFPQIYYPEDRPGIATSNGAMHPTGETGLMQTGQVRSIAYTRGARRALLVSYSSDELVPVDPNTHHSLALTHFTLSGNNPIGMVLTRDGSIGYVLYENSLYLSVIDTSAYASEELPRPAYVPFWISRKLVPQASASLVSYGRVTRDIRDVDKAPPLREVGKVTLLDEDPLDPQLRRGRILFASSNPDKFPTLTNHREGGCTICHGDGHNDGSMWVMLDGERRTMSLRGGVGGRGWLKAKSNKSQCARCRRQLIATVTRRQWSE